MHGRSYTTGMSIDPRRIELIEPATVEILRRMSPAEKLEMANRMVIQAREMLSRVVAASHPGWAVEQLAAEVRRRTSRGAA